MAFGGRLSELFQAKVSSVDAGVCQAKFDANGRLATLIESNRWIPDAQRFRLYFELAPDVTMALPAGAKATLQLKPSKVFYEFLAKLQVKFISLQHYICSGLTVLIRHHALSANDLCQCLLIATGATLGLFCSKVL